MKNIFNKNLIGIVFVSLLLVVAGVFSAGSIVHAADMNGMLVDCGEKTPIAYAGADCDMETQVAIADENCDMGNKMVQKTGSTSNTFMPCCLERHDNSETTIPSVLQERIKFLQYSITEGTFDTLLLTSEQKTYISSKSPPKKADILSSVIKIE